MPATSQLTEKLARLQALRPLEPAQVRALEERVAAAFAYHKTFAAGTDPDAFRRIIVRAADPMLDRYLPTLN